MSRIAVLNGIARESYTPDDQISAIGGESLPIADHPDFRGCFVPGSADDLEIQRLRKAAARMARRVKYKRFLGTGLGLLFLCASGALLWVSASSRLLVLPEGWMVEVEEVVGWWKNKTVRKEHYLNVVRVGDLPHTEWVQAQRPDPDGLALHRAMIGHWEVSEDRLETVRRSFLSAVSNSPLDPMPLAGLVQVDAAMLYTRPELLGEINRAMSRLDVLGAKGPAVAAARAELALAQGNRGSAREATEACVETDPVCSMLHGEATLDPQKVQEVIDQYGPSARALRTLCRTGIAAQDWLAVERCVGALQELDSDHAAADEFRSEMYASLGLWNQALSAAQRAVRKGSERAELMHLIGSIKFVTNPRDFELRALYTNLIGHPHLSGHTNREVVLVQAAQIHVGVGELEQAREIIDAALEAHPESHAARILLADILYKEGRHGDSESILRDIDTSGTNHRDAAIIHMWSARLYFEMGKQRLGRTEVENAIRLDPLHPFGYSELAWASVETRNIQGAVDNLEQMVLRASYRDLSTDPRSGIGLRAPKLRSLYRPILQAMSGDVRFDQEQEPTGAILDWWEGRPGHLAVMSEALEKFPNHMALQIAIALAAYDAGEWQVAHDNALAVLSRRPSLAIMHSVRGRALGKLGRWTEAVDPLNRSIKGEAEQALLLLWAAQSWIEKGDLDVAQALITKAIALEPGDPRIRHTQFALKRNGQ